MTLRAWRTAHAAAAGTSHARTGAPCLDAGRCVRVVAADGSEVLIASIADGAGSAAHAATGAERAVAAFYRAFADEARADPELGFLGEARAQAWLAALQAEIAGVAAEHGHACRDYACTFLGAIVGPGAAAFVQLGAGAMPHATIVGQIGDGAIVVGEPAAPERHWVFWPQHGEFANSTFFVTMAEAASLLQFARWGAVCELVMFSDGLERLILDMRSRTVHAPSVQPILAWVAGLPGPPDGRPSEILAAYLNSANVNRRTDDDKALIVATRMEPCPGA